MVFYPSSLTGTPGGGNGERADRTLKTIQRRETRKKEETGQRCPADSEDSEELRCANRPGGRGAH